MELNIEMARLSSFVTAFPQGPLSEFYSILSKNGFYASDTANSAQCFFCGVRVYNWPDIHDIPASHRLLSPDCPFLLEPESTNNCPTYSNLELKDERNRRKTFINWPVSFISPDALAKAGLYYKYSEDNVQCPWCFVTIGIWEAGDDPFQEHARFSPRCVKVIENSIPANEQLSAGIQRVELPFRPEFASLDARFRSFTNWTMGHVQDPKRLSEAGFYYLGVADDVRCFQCDGGFEQWLVNDDPWFEHARCFPNCSFLRLVMGQSFIDNVQSDVNDSSTVKMIPPSSKHPPMILENALNTKLSQLALNLGLEVHQILELTTHQIMQLITGQPDQTAVIEVSQQNSPSTSSSVTTSQQQKRSSQNEAISQSSDELVKRLTEENVRLKESRECKICLTEEVGVVFCPCGHLVSCVQCAPAIYHCPVCRALITGRVRIFLS
ncbi:putative inhibitor of apoptosis [Anopheles nili]|uniref:putative inhibitor of apoptosis n=1 Tax=Anopheles nili TaxID=185578 RepID=UPI00237A9419|nr:putative inhibitor of apoptosis [Anopheles nili]